MEGRYGGGVRCGALRSFFLQWHSGLDVGLLAGGSTGGGGAGVYMVVLI